MMTTATRPTLLTPAERARAEALRRSLPHAATLPRRAPFETVDGLLAWLSDYSRHAAQVDREQDARIIEAGRAVNVLRGLRYDLDRAASTLADLDATEAGRAAWGADR